MDKIKTKVININNFIHYYTIINIIVTKNEYITNMVGSINKTTEAIVNLFDQTNKLSYDHA